MNKAYRKVSEAHIKQKVVDNAKSNFAHIKVPWYTTLDMYSTAYMVLFKRTLVDHEKHNYIVI